VRHGRLDLTAASHGGFVDVTHGDDSGFAQFVGGQQVRAGPDSPARGRVDLLTVLLHELGLEDLSPLRVPHELMTATLRTSTRRLRAWSAVAPPEGDNAPALPPAPVGHPVTAPTQVLTADGSSEVLLGGEGGSLLIVQERSALLLVGSASP
jgi:hypothetical protein